MHFFTVLFYITSLYHLCYFIFNYFILFQFSYLFIFSILSFNYFTILFRVVVNNEFKHMQIWLNRSIFVCQRFITWILHFSNSVFIDKFSHFPFCFIYCMNWCTRICINVYVLRLFESEYYKSQLNNNKS